MTGNVIEFLPRPWVTKKTSIKETPMQQTAASVHRLIVPQWALSFHKERLTDRDVTATGFFELLFEKRMVTIVNVREEIWLTSLLRVEKESGNIYEITIKDFIRLTEAVPGMTGKHIDSYVMPLLNLAAIEIGMITEMEDSFTDEILDVQSADGFHCDKKLAAWDDGYYSCMIDDLDAGGITFSLDSFSQPANIPLLYLLCYAYQEYLSMGYSMKGNIRMELAKYEWNNTHTIYISPLLLDRVILSGIARRNPIYINISIENRIKKFHDDIVFPLLSDEYLEGEED